MWAIHSRVVSRVVSPCLGQSLQKEPIRWDRKPTRISPQKQAGSRQNIARANEIRTLVSYYFASRYGRDVNVFATGLALPWARHANNGFVDWSQQLFLTTVWNDLVVFYDHRLCRRNQICHHQIPMHCTRWCWDVTL